MTMLTKRLAAVAADVFGPKRAGDPRLADSKRARLDQPGLRPLIQHAARTSSMPLRIWRCILASVGLVALAVPLFWAIGGFGEVGLSDFRKRCRSVRRSKLLPDAAITTGRIGRPSGLERHGDHPRGLEPILSRLK